MKKNKRAAILLQIVGLSMVSVVAYAAIPGALAGVPFITAAPSTPDPKTKDADKTLEIASVQYGPEPIYFNAIPLGEAETAPPGASSAGPTAHGAPASYTPFVPPPGGPQPSVSVSQVPNVEIAASDCQLDQYGRRAPLTESRLVSVIQQGIAGFGAKVSIDQVRMLVQADLNRSGDDEKIKAEVLSELQSAYQPNSAPGLALSKPFDLNDSGMVYANGYDPCGNPGAIGGGRGVGSAFGQGPFASDFATINPVPVVAARTQATTEGGAI